MRPHVIVFNGVGSTGKSSAAKALQTLASERFLHVQGDVFLDMIPPRLWGDPDGIIFERSEKNGDSLIEISMGAAVKRLMEGFRQSVGALARAGNSCIVDDVMLSPEDQQSYRAIGADARLSFVALHAPLDVLEQRERDRGDRLIGLARWQFGRVHHGIEYDFEVDTSTQDANAVARRIAAALHLSVIGN
jgi:chloramphenicol 3-O phosphotransferase